MPYHATPWVRQGGVRLAHGEWIVIDSARWFNWLHEISAFCYSSRRYPIRLTVRHEQRRQQRYWYAYTKSTSKLHNAYLGKTDQLTQARLEQACQQLWQRMQAAKEVQQR